MIQAGKERRIWLDTMITLIVLETMSYFYCGTRALALGGLCVAVSLAADFLSVRAMGRRFTADDLTCTSDGLIIALMLPTVIDYKIAAIACVFAVIAAKNVFGGRRNIIFSPAAAAYVFVLTSWGKKLLAYPEPYVRSSVFEKPEKLTASASSSFNVTGKVNCSDFELLMGKFAGPAGTVSVLLLLIAAVMLIMRNDISAGAFIGTISGTGLFAYIVPVGDSRIGSLKYSIAMNMVLFAAIYIISDRRIAPERNYFAFFYGFFISAFAYTIVLTNAKENAIVIVSVLFTPVALGFKNLEKRINNAIDDEKAAEEAAGEEAPGDE